MKINLNRFFTSFFPSGLNIFKVLLGYVKTVLYLCLLLQSMLLCFEIIKKSSRVLYQVSFISTSDFDEKNFQIGSCVKKCQIKEVRPQESSKMLSFLYDQKCLWNCTAPRGFTFYRKGLFLIPSIWLWFMSFNGLEDLLNLRFRIALLS